MNPRTATPSLALNRSLRSSQPVASENRFRAPLRAAPSSRRKTAGRLSLQNHQSHVRQESCLPGRKKHDRQSGAILLEPATSSAAGAAVAVPSPSRVLRHLSSSCLGHLGSYTVGRLSPRAARCARLVAVGRVRPRLVGVPTVPNEPADSSEGEEPECSYRLQSLTPLEKKGGALLRDLRTLIHHGCIFPSDVCAGLHAPSAFILANTWCSRCSAMCPLLRTSKSG